MSRNAATVLVLLAIMLTSGTLFAVFWDPFPNRGTAPDDPRAALLADVDTLRIAQLSLADFDGFVPCGSAEEAQAALEQGWVGGDCWTRIGFTPSVERAAYWVEAEPDRLVVHGIADLDGDGTPMQAVATAEEPARFTTPAEIR